MALLIVFAVLFALATVNSAQTVPEKISLDQLLNIPYGSISNPNSNGGGSGGLPSGPIAINPIGANPGGDAEVQKIMAEGCEGSAHYMLGRLMRQSCSTYCGSSFMIGKCYNGVCYCLTR